MKTLLIFGFTVLFAFSVQAQEKPREQKAATIVMGVVPVSQIKVFEKKDSSEVARLYRRPNARIKKALSFTTIKDRPKVA